MSCPGALEGLLRDLAPRVLGDLTRRSGQFDLSEDAVQEALLAAATQWPGTGIPENPRSWLLTVATRRLTDLIRADSARRRRETTSDVSVTAPAADDDRAADRDDSLRLLFLCCHPALSEPSQIAVTLRSVAGLTTAQIAHAFLVPEATMAQRISRAKKILADHGARFQMPSTEEFPGRLGAVLHVLYLIFNEGYTASSGPDLLRVDLSSEAIRLTRALHQALPGDGEVTGLLSLMLLTDARRPARIDANGALIPLGAQDRADWNHGMIAEGITLITAALNSAPLGPYQIQAAIAAVHSEAPDTAATDWPQILGLYALLEQISPSPVVTLNRAVALAEVYGPDAGLRLLAGLDGDRKLASQHRLYAVRGHLHEMAGDRDAARAAYLAAARRTTSLPEKRYLERKAHTQGQLPDAGAGGGHADHVRVVVGETLRRPAVGVDELAVLLDVVRYGIRAGTVWVDPGVALEDHVGTAPPVALQVQGNVRVGLDALVLRPVLGPVDQELPVPPQEPDRGRLWLPGRADGGHPDNRLGLQAALSRSVRWLRQIQDRHGSSRTIQHRFPGRYRARMRLLRALCSTSARPSASRTGGT